jgi:membrane protein
MSTRTRPRPASSAKRAASRTKKKANGIVDRLIERLPGPVRDVVQRVRGIDIPLYASGLAFYALISAAPLAILCAWIASLVVGEDGIRRAAENMQQHAPGGIQMGSFLESIVSAGASLGLVAAISVVWPATSYGAGLRRAFHRLSPHSRREAEGLRGRGLALIVLLPVLVAGSLLGSFVGTSLLGDSGGAYVIGLVLALVTGFLAASVGTALIYRIFPPERMPLRSILKGTLFTAAAVSVLSLGMTVFVGAAGQQEQQRFGSTGMALLVLFGVWLFLSNAALLVGYVIAQED